MNQRTLLVAAALILAAGLVLQSTLPAGENAEPATTGDAAPATGATGTPAAKPEKIKIYVKGEDLLGGIEEKPVSADYSRRIIYQFFELALDSKGTRRKYDKSSPQLGGWEGLRKKMEIEVAYKNIKLHKPGLRKLTRNAEGKWQKGDEYTDDELMKLADYVVETTGTTKLEEITWFGKLTHYKYYARVQVKVTRRPSGEVIFDKTAKRDYTGAQRMGKKPVARNAIREACKAIGLEVIKLKEFGEKPATPKTPGKEDKSAEGEKTPEAPKEPEPPKPPVKTPETPKKPEAPKTPEKSTAG